MVLHNMLASTKWTKNSTKVSKNSVLKNCSERKHYEMADLEVYILLFTLSGLKDGQRRGHMLIHGQSLMVCLDNEELGTRLVTSSKVEICRWIS